MKPNRISLALVALSLAVSLPQVGNAQTIDADEANVIQREHPKAGPGVPEPPRITQSDSVSTTQHADGSVTAATNVRTESVSPARLQSNSVLDSTGATVATVERVIEDPQSGKIRFLVVSDLEHRYIVPFEAFTVANSSGDLTVRLNADPSKLAGAPQFQESRVLEYSTQSTSAPIYAYWSVEHQAEAKTR